MLSESLRHLRTHNQIKSADEVPRASDIRTHATLSGIEANTPVKQDNRAMEMALAHDRKLLNRQIEAIERSQKRLLTMRSKLKATKLWNQRIQEQRKQMMKQRRENLHAQPQTVKQPANEIKTSPRGSGLVVTY